jgi:hypothetical protein
MIKPIKSQSVLCYACALVSLNNVNVSSLPSARADHLDGESEASMGIGDLPLHSQSQPKLAQGFHVICFKNHPASPLRSTFKLRKAKCFGQVTKVKQPIKERFESRIREPSVFLPQKATSWVHMEQIPVPQFPNCLGLNCIPWNLYVWSPNFQCLRLSLFGNRVIINIIS